MRQAVRACSVTKLELGRCRRRVEPKIGPGIPARRPDQKQRNIFKSMKSFFGSFFGALFAIFLLVGVALVGCFAVIALIGVSEKGQTVADNSLLGS